MFDEIAEAKDRSAETTRAFSALTMFSKEVDRLRNYVSTYTFSVAVQSVHGCSSTSEPCPSPNQVLMVHVSSSGGAQLHGRDQNRKKTK